MTNDASLTIGEEARKVQDSSAKHGCAHGLWKGFVSYLDTTRTEINPQNRNLSATKSRTGASRYSARGNVLTTAAIMLQS